MNTHTQEPWIYLTKNMPSGPAICGPNTTILTAFAPYDRPDDLCRHEADMQRIVACVNACKDSTNEDLKLVSDAGGFALLIAHWNLEASAHADNADTFADEIEALEQERDHLAAQLAVSEAMYKSGCQFEDQCKSLAAQNAELIKTMKWIHNHGGLGYSIHGALEKAIAKAYSPDPFADKVGAV